jgi:hypothetical protein
VRWPGQQDAGGVEMSGQFLPDDYSWELPRSCPATLVFIDGPGALTARMITAALRRGVRTVVFTEGGAWRSKSLPLLAFDKLWSKLVAACVSASGPRGGPCQSLLDVGYRRSIRPALAAAPLAFSAQRLADSAASRDAPAGIVLACPTLVAGGAERQIVNTATGLRAAGLHPITVLVSRLHSPPGNAFFLDQLLAAGVDVREVRAAETGLQRWLDTRSLAQTPEGASTLALLQQLPQAIRQEVLDLGAEIASLNPAVVHCWLDYSNVRAGIAAVCAGVPRVVLSGRNVGPRHFPYIFEPFMRSAYRALLESPGVVLTNNSRGGAKDYAEWLGIDVEAVPVIYNGLDLERIQPPPQSRRCRFAANTASRSTRRSWEACSGCRQRSGRFSGSRSQPSSRADSRMRYSCSLARDLCVQPSIGSSVSTRSEPAFACSLRHGTAPWPWRLSMSAAPDLAVGRHAERRHRSPGRRDPGDTHWRRWRQRGEGRVPGKTCLPGRGLSPGNQMAC